MGFAIPVNTVSGARMWFLGGIVSTDYLPQLKRVVTQLIEHGEVVTPVIGVDLAPDFHTAILGITGVLVLRVRPGQSVFWFKILLRATHL